MIHLFFVTIAITFFIGVWARLIAVFLWGSKSKDFRQGCLVVAIVMIFSVLSLVLTAIILEP